MVTQYNTKNPDINKWLAKYWNILETNWYTTSIFKDRPMVPFRKRPTLRDILTSSSVQYPYLELENKITNPTFCKKSPGKCTRCPKISKEDNIICTITNHMYDKLPRPSKGYLTCNLTNIIYCITSKLKNLWTHNYILWDSSYWRKPQ